jgi:threonine dehydrogenase-like Zn-dependent dehydrogenase
MYVPWHSYEVPLERDVALADLTDTLETQKTAEYVRVPFADDSLVRISNNSADDLEYLFLSDIFATGWAALDFSGFQPGDSVAVFGAGPVGLLCAYSAMLRGASKVFAVDHVKARLEKAASIGAIPIDFTQDGKGAAALILEKDSEGVVRSCDCCGYECVNADLELQSDYVMQEAIKVTAVGGGIGSVGVYADIPTSEGVPRGGEISGHVTMDLSTMFNKSLSFKIGLAPIIEVNPRMLQLIQSGRAKPSFIVSSEVGINDAPKAYRRFDQRLETKVVIRFPWEWDTEQHP